MRKNFEQDNADAWRSLSGSGGGALNWAARGLCSRLHLFAHTEQHHFDRKEEELLYGRDHKQHRYLLREERGDYGDAQAELVAVCRQQPEHASAKLLCPLRSFVAAGVD